jgi:hypothetical protein
MADSKITELTELTEVADGDLLVIVDDPSGSPITKKITRANLVAGVGGGQTLYECVVATSGGDYTTLGAAIAAGKTRIFIRNGTYSESGNPIIPSNCVIHGQSRNGVIIDVDGTTYDQLRIVGGAATKIELRNFTIRRTTGSYAIAQPYATGDYLTEFIADNIFFNGGGFRCGYVGNNSTKNLSFTNCVFRNISSSACVYVRSAESLTVDGYFTFQNCKTLDAMNPQGVINILIKLKYVNIDNNIFICTTANNYSAIYTFSTYATNAKICISNNLFTGWGQTGGGGAIATLIVDGSIFTGNVVRDCYNGMNAVYNGALISGNKFEDCSNVALTISGDDTAILGNQFKDCGTALTITGDRCAVTGNSFENNTTNITAAWDITTFIDDSNRGLTETEQYVIRRMKNTSGGALAAGDVVVLKASAAGNEVTTTTTGGDDMVYGMSVDTLSDATFGYFLVKGKTTALKVDGTTDIAIGDYLSTFTTAKIAKKAAAGDMAFAIALEAYTGDDSNGVIDALLITPRKVGAVV